nr:hypothetical protein CFP56_03338 [Quercus suber]
MAPREEKARRLGSWKRGLLSSRPPPTPVAPERMRSAPTTMPSRPVAVPTPQRASHQASSQRTSSRPPQQPRRSANHSQRRTSPAHDPTALPPAVAALLAVTAIPPRRTGSLRRKSSTATRISIDELVNEWKSDDALTASCSSSPALGVLLEDIPDMSQDPSPEMGSMTDDGYMNARSVSCDSMPSLDLDSKSVLSLGSPSTPGSLRSRQSSSNLRKEKSRSLPVVALDHPLSPPSKEDQREEDGLLLYQRSGKTAPPKPKFSFKSNLTTSLQALRHAALSSISSFTLSSMTAPAQRSASSPFTDEMLWAHPYIFPRMTSELRPVLDGTPSEAQRRYLNPTPLTFEEQEAPYQQALHAPFLSEPVAVETPTIPLQTYNRGKRKPVGPRRRVAPAADPQSEAGRALAAAANTAAAGVRQREVRENSDFLRVVVLEMNMRRVGKLETGKARIWLPPRQVSLVAGGDGGDGGQPEVVPRRWVGEVAAY